MTSVTSSSVSLKWNASSDNVGVTGYTIYRNGASVGSTGGPAATTFTDLTASPNTSYSYTVDAFDGSGNHSARSAPVSVTTPAPTGVQAVQAGATATATRVTSTTIVLANPVHAGDLLAGWLGQYDAAGQVQVSDNVNGPWTRTSASTTFSSGGGDLALFYLQNSAPAPFGLTITITATSATYLQGAVSEYSGVATAGALDQVAAAKGNSTAVDSGPTAPVGAGELVVGGIITGGIARDGDAGLLAGQALHPAGPDQLGLGRHRGHRSQQCRNPGRPGHLRARPRTGTPPSACSTPSAADPQPPSVGAGRKRRPGPFSCPLGSRFPPPCHRTVDSGPRWPWPSSDRARSSG